MANVKQLESLALSGQLALFAEKPTSPEGLRYAAGFISSSTEIELIERFGQLPLAPFQFGQYEGKRRVASFGFSYDYTLRKLKRADPIPPWLGPLVQKVEAFGGPDTNVRQVLFAEYQPGAGIGWHRLASGQAPFRQDFWTITGIVLQVSLSAIIRSQMGSLYARRGSTLALRDVRGIQTNLGAQHSRRRSGTVLDHVSDDD